MNQFTPTKPKRPRKGQLYLIEDGYAVPAGRSRKRQQQAEWIVESVKRGQVVLRLRK